MQKALSFSKKLCRLVQLRAPHPRHFTTSKPDSPAEPELSELELALLEKSAINRKFRLRENLPTGMLVAHAGKTFLIDRFDNTYYIGTDSSFLDLQDLDSNAASQYVELGIDKNTLKTLFSQSRESHALRFLKIEDLVKENLVVATGPKSIDVNKLFSKQKNLFKRDKSDHKQFCTGLIGFDWTNPIFCGSFVHVHSDSLDTFKHEFTSLIVDSSANQKDDNGQYLHRSDFKIVYLGLHSASQNSLRKQFAKSETGCRPDSLYFALDSSSFGSEKASKIKLMLRAIITVLRELKSSENVLFLLDDLNIIHKEIQGTFEGDGHQVCFLRDICFLFSNYEHHSCLMGYKC